jgi:hypothetical protein
MISPPSRQGGPRSSSAGFWLDHKLCKVSVLLEARLEILLLIFFFVRYQNFVWVLGEIGLGVHIGDV